MNKNLIVAFGLAGILVAGSFAVAQAPKAAVKAADADPRIDKILEQNEKILKTQQDIMDKLEKLDKDLLQVRRRSG